jgi:quinolinate synthase
MLWQPSLPDRYLAMSDEQLATAITARRRELGDSLLILGHHYQQDDVIRHADLTGDSLKLSQMAATEAARRGTKFIVFCGVHFMAETADLLTDESVRVILPDLAAGCSMADMASHDDVIEAWKRIDAAIAGSTESPPARRSRGVRGSRRRARVIPVTYVNSTAAIKAFVGERGGACCTSSNAADIFRWAMNGGTEPVASNEEIRLLFLPDQHLGRNTASRFGLRTEIDEAAGRGPSQCAVWNPKKAGGGLSDDQIRSARVLLWAGHCSVHKLFRPEHVDQVRADYEGRGGVTVLVHPECCKEVVDRSDMTGSTEFIIRTIESARQGSNWALGTETHLVNRLAQSAARRGVHVVMLSGCHCLCTTMYRIDQPHLLWALDHLAHGKVVNEIRVPGAVRRSALLALDRMLAHVGAVAHNAVPALVD